MEIQAVFDAHPTVSEIYVVDGMPFTDIRHASNHAKDSGKTLETIARPVQAAQGPDDVDGSTGPDEATAEALAEAPTQPAKKQAAPAEGKSKK